MKLSCCFLHRNIACMLFLVISMGIIPFFGNAQMVQTAPKKGKSQLRSIYSSVPSGYQQLGMSTLYYKQTSGAIDLIGQFGSQFYSSTYSNGGYKSAMKVGSNGAVSINSSLETTSDGVTVKINVVEYNGLAQFQYSVTNTNATEKVISLGSYADVMIGDNDRAPIVRKNYLDGDTYGLQMKHRNEEITSSLVLLFGKGMDGVTPVDDYWFGNYGANSNPNEIVGNYQQSTNWKVENGNYDSALGWCWKERVLPPNSTTIYSVLIGVGDVTLLPMIQNLEVSVKDTTLWNTLSNPRVFTLTGTYFSPASHKGVIYYSVDEGEWMQLSDSLASEERIEQTVSASFPSSRPVHSVRFSVKDQAGANSPYYTISYREVSSLTVSGLQDMEYTGEAVLLPSLAFSDPQSSVPLVPDEQFAFYYSNNVNAGQASVHVQGLYPHTIGENLIHFNILPATLSGEITLPVNTFAYTGGEIIPDVHFKDERFGDLNGDTDYELSFANNKFPGRATVTLKGKGNYSGEITASFEITKKSVEKEDLTFENYSEVVYYDGNPHPVVLKNLEGLGAYTVYYVDSEGNRSTDAPIEPGNYIVSVVFEEGDYFHATEIENVAEFSIKMMAVIENMVPEENASLSSATVNFSWKGDELTKSYHVYLWKEGDPVPTKPVASYLPMVRYQNSIFCDYDNRYCWKIEGFDENRKLVARSEVVTFTVQPAPDLHVTGIECGEAWAGQSLDISWTVKNDGKRETGNTAWRDNIWLVPDLSNGFSNGAVKGIDNVKALSAGESYQNHATIDIGERIAGDYYIVVAADMGYIGTIDWSLAGNEIPEPYTPSLDGNPYPYLKATFSGNRIDEVGEKRGYSDNFYYKKINIQVPALPDLQVLSVVPPENSLSGQPVTVVATIINKGVATKSNASWCDEIFISPTNEFDETTAKSLDKVYHRGGLAAGEQYTVPFNVTIPAGYEGAYYFFVKTNVYENVYEHALSENNMAVSEKTIQVIASPTSDIVALSLDLPVGIDGATSLAIHGKGKNGGLADTDVSSWTDYVYASSNGKMLDGSAVLIGKINHYGALKRGEEYEIDGTVSLSGLEEGNYYIYVKVNGNGRVADSDLGNNVIRAASTVQVAYPDLTVTDLVVPDILNAGCRYPISYTIHNNGSDVEDFALSDWISFYHEDGEIVKNVSVSHILSLKKGASWVCETELYVPVLPSDGTYHLAVRVNANEKLPEKSLENNVSESKSARYTRYKTDAEGNPIVDTDGNQVIEPVLDLSLRSVMAPVELTTSTDFMVSWEVENTGEDKCADWITGIYLQVGDKQVLLTEVEGTVLEEGGLYQGEASLSVPDKHAPATELIFETRFKRLASDGNSENNRVVVPIRIKSAPLPDLRIKDMKLTSLVAGSTATLTYEVENVGAGETRVGDWTDQVYLTGEVSLGGAIANKNIHRQLASGDSYKETISFKVPKDYEGNYNLFLKVDRDDLLYEGEEKDNNVVQQFVTVISPVSTPTDLMVESVETSTSYQVGEKISIRWTIRNSSEYPTAGTLKDAIYLSEDQEWDESDLLVGTVSGTVSLQAGESVERVATGIINSAVPGRYYVIIRTNQLNSILESDYQNNAMASAASCQVDFKELAIGSNAQVDGQGFFKLAAEEGESLLLHLEADGTEKGFNLYMAHDRVATVTGYDYASVQPNEPYQEILVPEMKAGTYYILAQQREFVSGVENNFTLGESTSEVERMQMTLSSKLLEFGISRMDKPEGGNGGSATSTVYGAKFDSIMDYRLKRDNRVLPAEAIYFQNSSESLVTFNLNEEALGTYDVVVEKQGGTTREVKSGYTVVQDSPNKLLTKIIASSSFRSGTTNPVTIEYANDGLSDVVVSELLLVSENGHPIGMTAKETEKGETELRIPIAEPGTNQPMSVAPGGKGTFTVYIHASSVTTVSLQLYVIE